MRRWIVSLVFVLVLGVLGSLVYWQSNPQLVAVEPAPDAMDVAPFRELRLIFSVRMQPGTVEQRLVIEPAIPGEIRWEDRTLIFTPTTPWPSEQAVNIQLAAGSRSAGLLPLPLSRDQSWSFTVRRPSLLYLYPSDGPPNLYRLDPLSGASQRLTDYPAGVVDYHARPDGQFIYYSLRSSQGGSAIYRLSLNEISKETSSPPEPELVLSCPQVSCRNPQPAPQGDFLAYEQTSTLDQGGPAYPQVWLLPLPGDQPGTPSKAGDPQHQSYDPLWSPDGWLAFYDVNDKAYQILEPRTGERRTFANSTGQVGGWEGDVAFVAPEIYFSEVEDTQGSAESIAYSHLLRYELDTGQVQDLSLSQNLEDAFPVFSPDGAYLAFARKYLDLVRWTPGRQLWLARQSDRQAVAITIEPTYNHYAFTWSPQADQLVYVRFNQDAPTEPPEIWSFDLATSERRLLLPGGFAPQWIP